MWKYVENELDEKYKGMLPDSPCLSSNDLPESEFNIRSALATWHMKAFVPFNSLSWLDKTFDKGLFKAAKQTLEKYDDAIIEMLKSKPEKLSAFKRILSVMPDDVPQKEYFLSNILPFATFTSELRNASYTTR